MENTLTKMKFVLVSDFVHQLQSLNDEIKGIEARIIKDSGNAWGELECIEYTDKVNAARKKYNLN